MKKYNNVIAFCQSAPEYTTAMQDYFNEVQSKRGVENLSFSTTASLTKKGEVINKLFNEELTKRSGMAIPAEYDEIVRFAGNPNVVYFANEIIDTTIDMILPEALISSIGYIADIRHGGYLDSFTFDLKNNALFSVVKSGQRKRRAPAQVLKGTTVTLAPELHDVTTYTALADILSGRENVSDYVVKIVRSIEAQMFFDAYDGFTAVMENAPAGLKADAYDENELISLCEKVTAYNQNRKAVILGTSVALKSVLPSSANMRILLEDEYVTAGYIHNFNGYDVIMMPQVADFNSSDYGLKLADDKIYVVSPASDKIMKVAVGGATQSNMSGNYESANLSVFNTVKKAWDVQAATNSVAAVMTIA